VFRKRPVIADNDERFGERLARFRQVAGFSQRPLAAKIGISTADDCVQILDPFLENERPKKASRA
jgi:transcriptional regulator with XRE-family HTH domain